MKAQLCLSVCLLWFVVNATHFRYGIITYDQVTGQARQFRFNAEQAWRWSAWSYSPIGSTVYINDHYSGDGSYVYPTWVVNAANSANDWFVATMNPVLTTYGSDGSFTSFAYSCCRISTLLNNRDGWWRVSALVRVSANQNFRSMKSSMVPITFLAFDQQARVQIGVLPQQSEQLTYRTATDTEAGYYSGAWYPPSGISVEWNTGIINWTPPSKGLWTYQVIVKANSGSPTSISDDSTMTHWMAIDWIFQVVDTELAQCKRFCSNKGQLCGSSSDCSGCVDERSPARTPFCDSNTAPYFTLITIGGVNTTLVSKTSYTLSGKAVFSTVFTISLYAIDLDPEDFITIGTSAIPSGATLTQTNSQESVIATFKWTPGDNDISGSVVCFTAIDSLGNNAIGSLCVQISVGQGTLEAEGSGLISAVAGVPTTFDVRNSMNRNHTLTLSGPAGTFYGVIIPTGTQTSGTGTYLANYTLFTSGSYALTLADSTPTVSVKPPSVVRTLVVTPSVTDPLRSVIFEQGSTGTTGGIASTVVFFYLRPFDTYGNSQYLRRSDLFYFTLRYNNSLSRNVNQTLNMTWEPYTLPGGIEIDYRYKGNYTIPSIASGQTTYNLTIYFKSSWTSPAVTIRSYTPSVAFTPFSIQPINELVYVVGNPVSFQFTTDLPDSTKNDQVFVAYMLGQIASVTRVSSNLYQFQSTQSLQIADVYSNAVEISAPGLGQAVTSSNSGTVRFDVTYNNDDPDYNNSYISPSSSFVQLGEIPASTSKTRFLVRLFDKFKNPCTKIPYSVSYTITDASSTPILGNALASSLSPGGFYLDYVPNKAGYVVFSSMATWNSGVNSLNIQSISGTVVAGPFSSQASTISGTDSSRATVAGFTKTLTIEARDFLGNLRNVNGDGDIFNSTLLSSSGSAQSGITNYQQISGTATYVFSYYTEAIGSWKLDIKYKSSDSNGTMITFKTLDIKVWAGLFNQTEVHFIGADSSQQRSTAEIIIESKDYLGNTIENQRGGHYVDTNNNIQEITNFFQVYIVEVVSVNEQVHSYYKAAYCNPSTRSKPKCGVSELEGSVQNATERNYTTADLIFQKTGFFRIFYTVPDVNFGNGTYTVNIYFVNSTSSSVSFSSLANSAASKLIGSYKFTSLSDALQIESETTQFGYLVVFGAAGGMIFVSSVSYGAWRLSRYRPKYHQQKKEADEAEQVLEEMRDEGAIHGARDYMAVGAAHITVNPLNKVYQADLEAVRVRAKETNPALNITQVKKTQD